MPRDVVQFQLKTSTGEMPVILHLDQSQMTQKSILDYLKSGKFYEPETSELLGALLQPGDTFVDVGGHVGYFSMLAAALVGPRGRVMVFEPERQNYEHILAHIAANKLQNVLPFPWAVGDGPEVVELYVNSDNDGGHALWNVGNYPGSPKSRANVRKVLTYQTKLDNMFGGAGGGGAGSGAVKLMKLDVEGSELHVLKGARELLTRARVPAVVLEINHYGLQQRGVTEMDIRRYMYELGYASYLLPQWPPVLLAADKVFQSPYVFNLLFVTPELQAVVRDKWPQG